MSEIKNVPAVVIGLGVAGCTAAIYLSRMGIQPLAFEGDKIGGHINKYDEITDYPAFKGTGEQLAKDLKKQLDFNSIEIIPEFVETLYKDNDGMFIIKSANYIVKTKAVVIASGLKNKTNFIQGDIEVSINPMLNVDEIKDKNVAIYGGGKLAYSAALYLSNIANKVSLINNICEAPTSLKNEVDSKENIDVIQGDYSYQLDGVDRIYDLPSNSRMIGNTKFCLLKEIIDDQGNIAVDKEGQSFVKGIFAAGDVVQKSFKSLATAVYDGAMCGVMIYRLLTGMDQVS